MADVRFRSVSVLLAVAVLAMASLARPVAAASTGEVTGVVQDADGKALPEVEVTLLKAGESTPKKKASGADGGFKFDGLAGGIYIVSASKEGLSPVTCRGFRVVGDQSRRLEIKMLAGDQPSTCTLAEAG
ncbi:MAG TPA: carboxypeptidase-like regulatory domain-containing protein [Thermoanaerobaculia bacterium]|nr:carboxypeptidase-like regulatory domain-containing protein [Thermoanaerobaculia bacterium]